MFFYNEQCWDTECEIADKISGSVIVPKQSKKKKKLIEFRGNALKGEKPGRKVPPNAAEWQIPARARDVVGVKKE